VEQNYNEQFTAWISKEANNPAGILIVPNLIAHGLLGLISESEKQHVLTTPRAQISLHI